MLVQRLRSFVLCCAAGSLLCACAPATRTTTGAAGAPVPPAAAALPVLTPTAPPATLDAASRFAWQQTVQFGDALAAGDADAFLAKVSSGFYRGYAVLEASLRRMLAGTSARSAVVAVRDVADENGRVSVSAEWTRSITRADGTVDARHGSTVFVFLKSDSSLRLLDYRGDTPFAIDGI